MAGFSDEQVLEEKLGRLEEILRSMRRVLVAYSGGVDSALLAVAARRFLGPDGVVAVTAESESYPSGELEAAARICREFDIRHEVIRTRELENPDYARNPPDRCYFCKQEIFGRMARLAGDLGFDHVAHGQNADDLGDFRPGEQAAQEWGVRAPFVDAGITKTEIRELARRWGIPVWDRPATACLSSRFPYGTPITAEGLRQVDRAEHFLRDCFGFQQMRVRHHGDLARIELLLDDLSRFLRDERAREEVVERFSGMGYERITVDLRGFRSGSLNEVLQVHQEGKEGRVEQILEELGVFPAEWEERERMICLRLRETVFPSIAELDFRDRMIRSFEEMGFLYIALDLRTLD